MNAGRCPFCGELWAGFERELLAEFAELVAMIKEPIIDEDGLVIGNMEGGFCGCGAIWYGGLPDVEPKDDGL